MKDISTLVRENYLEAVELLKKNGGRINFCQFKGEEPVCNPDVLCNTPFVITTIGDVIEDTNVLAARLTYDKECEIEFLCMNTDDNGEDYIRWENCFDCIANTENDVYLIIDELLNK